MTIKDKKDNDEGPSANIFNIVDGIVENVDKTKKLVVIMLIAIVVSVPLSFHITNILLGPPYFYGPARIAIPFFLILAFAIVGVRQWVVLSKWTRKYKQYKTLQKQVDEKFDFEGSSDNTK